MAEQLTQCKTAADFDGHVEYPLEKMTTEQRLDWLDDMRDLLIETGVVKPVEPLEEIDDQW